MFVKCLLALSLLSEVGLDNSFRLSLKNSLSFVVRVVFWVIPTLNVEPVNMMRACLSGEIG
jgi:hypothetical protein